MKKIFLTLLFLLLSISSAQASGAYYGFAVIEDGAAGRTPAQLKVVVYDLDTPVDQATYKDQQGNPVIAFEEFKAEVEQRSAGQLCEPNSQRTNEYGEMIFNCSSDTQGTLIVQIVPISKPEAGSSNAYTINFYPVLNQENVDSKPTTDPDNLETNLQQDQLNTAQNNKLSIPADEVNLGIENKPEKNFDFSKLNWEKISFATLGVFTLIVVFWFISSKK